MELYLLSSVCLHGMYSVNFTFEDYSSWVVMLCHCLNTSWCFEGTTVLEPVRNLICIIWTNSYIKKTQYIRFHIIPDMFQCRLHHPQGKLY
jgi:hypothetical protein